MWKKTAKWSLLGLLLVYVVAMFVWSRAEASRHKCTAIEVEIEGDNKIGTISEESVKSVLDKYPKPIVGAPLNSINTLDIADYLRKYNNFESVECLMTSQSRLKVKVVPMIPEIRVFDGDRSYYVNKDGKIINSTAKFFVDVPVVSGHFTKDFTPQQLLPVVRFIKSDPLLSELTAMIVANDRENIIIVPRIKGHVINLGDGSRLEEKSRAIATAYHKILPNKGWETYDTISVKFRGQIVATRRDKTVMHPVVEMDEENDGEEMSLAGVEAIGNEVVGVKKEEKKEEVKAPQPAENEKKKEETKKPAPDGTNRTEQKKQA